MKKKGCSVGQLALEEFSLGERGPPLGGLVGLAVVHLWVEDSVDQPESQLVPELQHVPPQLVRVLGRVGPQEVHVEREVGLTRKGELVQGQSVHVLLSLVPAGALGQAGKKTKHS